MEDLLGEESKIGGLRVLSEVPLLKLLHLQHLVLNLTGQFTDLADQNGEHAVIFTHLRRVQADGLELAKEGGDANQPVEGALPRIVLGGDKERVCAALENPSIVGMV